MKASDVRKVAMLAREVADLADEALKAAAEERERINENYASLGDEGLTTPLECLYTKQSSALRRRSMDLTRALATMRNGYRSR